MRRLSPILIIALLGFVLSLSCGEDPKACGDGTTWASLYKDYFGPGSKGTCSGAIGDENNCHLDASSSGSLASNGYVCGPTKDTCFVPFKATLVPPNAGKTHYFEAVLRQEPGSGCMCSPMPLRPASAAFTECDLNRIRAWADKGAPND